MDDRRCSCMEVHGENPACPKHGRGTKWGMENADPETVGLADRLIAYAECIVKRRDASLAGLADDLRLAASEIDQLSAALSSAIGEPYEFSGWVEVVEEGE